MLPGLKVWTWSKVISRKSHRFYGLSETGDELLSENQCFGHTVKPLPERTGLFLIVVLELGNGFIHTQEELGEYKDFSWLFLASSLLTNQSSQVPRGK